MKILFVCGKNKRRSPTAEQIYKNDQRIQVRSAGTSKTSPRKINQELIDWADLILTMERSYQVRIRDTLINVPPIECLYIEDRYNHMEPKLIELIKEKVEPIIERHLRLK